jgi:hypothetical protein
MKILIIIDFQIIDLISRRATTRLARFVGAIPCGCPDRLTFPIKKIQGKHKGFPYKNQWYVVAIPCGCPNRLTFPIKKNPGQPQGLPLQKSMVYRGNPCGCADRLTFPIKKILSIL